MNRKLKIILICFSTFIAMMILLAGPLLRLFVSGKIKQIEERYSLIINYDKLRMSALSGIKVDKVCIYPKGGDTLFSADYISLKINPLKLLFFSVDLRRLDAENIDISFIKRDSVTSNFDFLYKVSNGNKIPSDTPGIKYQKSGFNYARTTDNMLSMLLRVLPARVNIKNLNINYNNAAYKLNIFSPLLKIDNDTFEAKIISTENGKSEVLFSEGTLDDSERKVAARIFTKDSAKFSVPFLKFRWGAMVRFDSLAFELSGSVKKNDKIIFNGKALASGLTVFHEKLSPDIVFLKKGTFGYKINVGKNYFELDSISTIHINNLSLSPYLRAEKNAKWKITASLNKPFFPADELFSSLPKGLFYNLEGIKTEGSLRYHFYLNLDFSQIDSLKLESSLESENFKILKYGNTNLSKMNEDFEYTAYEQGFPVCSFIVGPANNNFRSLSKISPYLQMAVLQSEDGGFFYHGGFLLESIRGALAEDIKEKKFERGGSTISMQLVKNVFLKRNKTLTRKFEEMIIVWLIETNRLSSKERMFEVYLNIIEWGPMVYGANEAARFYFDKDVKDININEAIFLASIIPAPKRALSSFTDDFQLKPFLEGYYKLLAQRFRIKGLITEQEEAAIKPEVRISGDAKRVIQNRQLIFVPLKIK